MSLLFSPAGRVLIEIAREPEIRREVLSERLEISPSTVFRAVRDLEEAGLVVAHEVGSARRYEVRDQVRIGDVVVRDLLLLLGASGS